MLMVFMISRRRCGSSLAALLLGSALLTVACQKVPLLAPSGSTITLTALATVLPLKGSTDLIAQVIEAGGTPPHRGTLVTFTTTLGSVQPSEAETDTAGRVTVKYVAGTDSGTATITAISGGVSASGTNAIKIAIGAAAIGSVRIDANPSVILATGGTSTITATTFDVNGNVLGSVPISFTTDAGGVSPAVANTDANGKAQTTLTTTKVAKVTATAGVTTSGGSGSTTTTSSPQTATVTVTVNTPPNITVGAPSPASPSVGQSVTFPLTYASDANGSPIQSVTVDFGDRGNPTTYTGKPASVSHIYTAIGSYSIRATAIDTLGDTTTASGSVNVGALASVTVGAASPALPSVGQAVTFPLTYGAAASPIERVSADFGDATATSYNGTPSSVSHTYTVGGTYAVRVTAYDAFGNSSVGGTSVLVSARPQPTVSITTTTTNPTAGSDITFTASVTPAAGSGTNITGVSVSFGDGTTTNLGPVSGSNIAIHHVYVTAGTYTVVLTATDSNGGVGTATTTTFVQTATPLGVTLSASRTVVDAQNTLVTFTATVTGLGNAVVQDYRWVFDDGTPDQHSTTNTFVHNYTYGVGATHTPRNPSVIVTPSAGAPVTASVQVTP